MKKFIFVSAIIELLAGLILFLVPQLIPDLAQGQISHMAMARMYGAAALGLGTFAFNVWRNIESETMVKTFLSSFLIFQMTVFIALLASFFSRCFF